MLFRSSEPTDYETEFRKIIESGQGGQGLPRSSGSALESGAGRVQRTTGEIDADSEQVERPEVREQNQSEVNVTPSLDMANTPAFREAPESLATRNRLVDDLENAGIPQGELVADVPDEDLDAMYEAPKRLHQAMRARHSADARHCRYRFRPAFHKSPPMNAAVHPRRRKAPLFSDSHG